MTRAIYGSCELCEARKRTQALSLLLHRYWVRVISPSPERRSGDLIGVPSAIGIVALMTLVDIPLAVALKKAIADGCELN